MDYKAILLEKKDGIATVTINQPKTMNCLVQDVFDELGLVTKELAADGDVKAVILTGAGRAFCAGGDLNRFMEGFDRVSSIDYVDAIRPWCLNWVNLKKPTIAAVNGPAVGAGLSLVLMCDISIVSDQAKLGSAFISMGLIPDLAAAYFLPRTVGPQKAKELLLTGRQVSAQEALEIGMVNRVVPHDQVIAESVSLAKQLANGPSFAIWSTKRMINMSLDMDLKNLLELESLIQGSCFTTDDSKEAVDAFLHKRKPVFKGR